MAPGSIPKNLRGLARAEQRRKKCLSIVFRQNGSLVLRENFLRGIVSRRSNELRGRASENFGGAFDALLRLFGQTQIEPCVYPRFFCSRSRDPAAPSVFRTDYICTKKPVNILPRSNSPVGSNATAAVW